MKTYKNIITLSKNERGIWDLDTVKGCASGVKDNINGCYGDCYALKTAKRYGIDFSKSIERHFIDEQHIKYIVNSIEKIDMPFIRIGCSGDPSENWQHTINIIEKLSNYKNLYLFNLGTKKEIVIITRHWNVLTDLQLNILSKYNICINTSISALDTPELINKSLEQYNRLKPFCKSVLRVITCDFNKQNKEGIKRNEIQKKLLVNENIIDTVFRPSKNNYFVKNGIINIERARFVNSKQYVSKNNPKAYLGKCKNCAEMCGLNNLNK